MKPRLPKKLYQVCVTKSSPSRYGLKKGGIYNILSFAIDRVRDIRRQGGDAAIYECTPEWKVLEDV